MHKTVSIEHSGRIATVILDRPGVRNAVDPPTAAALVAAFQLLDADDAVHAMVLWGAGGTFCAGADLRAVSQGWERTALQPPHMPVPGQVCSRTDHAARGQTQRWGFGPLSLVTFFLGQQKESDCPPGHSRRRLSHEKKNPQELKSAKRVAAASASGRCSAAASAWRRGPC